MPCRVRIPSAQCIRTAAAVPADHVEAGPARVRGPDLEPRGVDDAVDLVGRPAGADAVSGTIASTPLPSVWTRWQPGSIEGDAGTRRGSRAACTAGGTRPSGRWPSRRPRRCRRSAPDLAPSSRSRSPRTPRACRSTVRSSSGSVMIFVADALGESVQPSMTRSSSAVAAGLVRGEVLEPALLPARRGDRGEPLGIDRPVVARRPPTRVCAGRRRARGRRARGAGRTGRPWRPVPMIATRLSASLVKRSARRDPRRCSRSPTGWCGRSDR